MEPTVDKDEKQKRTSVFAKKPRTILVKVFGADPIPGLVRKFRNDERVDDQHRKEAQERGLNPNAYHRQKPRPETGQKADTGFAKFQRESGIWVDTLLEQLAFNGYGFTGGHYFFSGENNKPVSVLTFTLLGEGEETVLPPDAVEMLRTQRFGQMDVWCNLRFKEDGSGQFRLDTINLSQPHIPGKKPKPSRRLVIDGSTYRLDTIKPDPPLPAD